MEHIHAVALADLDGWRVCLSLEHGATAIAPNHHGLAGPNPTILGGELASNEEVTRRNGLSDRREVARIKWTNPTQGCFPLSP